MKQFTLLLLIIFSVNLSISAQSPSVYEAEAGMIYNFTKFFDWPQTEKSGDFIIGVYGSRELFKELTAITKDKKNVTQNIIVKSFSDYDDITDCHVIYINSFNASYIKEIHKKTGVHCLIISDSMTAIEKGAVIQFFIENERLKYDFSMENALKHGLKFHSKVSEMARTTYTY